MTSSLRRRMDAVTSEHPYVGVTPSVEYRARVAAGLYGFGALIGLAVVLLPHPAQLYEFGFYAVSGAAAVTAAFLHLAAPRVPAWMLHAVTTAGTLLISAAIYFSGEAHGSPAADNEMLFLWIALYAAYFFTRGQAMFQIFVVGVAYWIVLALSAPSSVFATRYAETVGTLAVAAFLVQLLRDRVGDLVGRLADAARTDPLTGLRNRRGFEELMQIEIERARRADRPLSVLICDIDHFKRVNDRLGHAAGDEALVQIGQILALGKRQIDAVARTGGEEFTLILPDTQTHGAFIVAERLRDMVQRRFSDRIVPLTVSVGIATLPEHGQTAESLLASADQALYAAKELGRNRSVIHSDEIASLAPSGAGEVQLATLLSLAEALDVRDTGTADHSQTVGRYCALIARELGLPPARVERVRIAGVVHDIGKIGLPDSILRKPGPLTDDECAQMRRHPEIGAGILGNRNFDDVRAWVLAHHERPDGKGYPRGLEDGEIPLEAKILAVADAYEAMTADRVYRTALGSEPARQELRRRSGTQFDRRIVEAFLTALDRDAAMDRVRPLRQ